jgi:glucosamine kinase
MRLHFALLCGGCQNDDEPLVSKLCGHWNVASLADLLDLGRRGWGLSPDKARNHMGAFAPVLTSAAEEGSEIALHVCHVAASAVAEGIGLVGTCFKEEPVPIALIGSTVRSRIMTDLVTRLLTKNRFRSYRIKEPDNPPIIGAVLMALRQVGVDLSAARGLPELKRFVAAEQPCHEA